MNKLIVSLCALGLGACSNLSAKVDLDTGAEPSVAPVEMAESVAQVAPAFTLPEYQSLTLSNGLTVYLMERHEVPLITVSAMVKAGAVHDSDPGLAALTAEGLLLGTRTLDKASQEQLVEGLGASLSSRAAKEGTQVSARFLAKDADTMLPLFAEVLIQPGFPAAEVNKARDRYVATLKQQKESPRQVINHYFDALLYGEHPYANATVGNGEAVAKLDAYDLKLFHGSWYHPGNTALVLVGDFDSSAMTKRVQALFGGWAPAQTPTPPRVDMAMPNPDKARVLLVNKADARETTFLIGGPGIARDNPDYVGLQVINTILGGRFTSWLNDALRVNAGLTYGARSRFTTYSETGSFAISTFTATANTQAAIDLALETYARLWQQGIDQATLDSAKAYVKGQFPPKFETSSQLAALLGQMDLYGMDPDQINAFQQQIDSLTLERANELVNQYFPREKLQFVLVGKADDIRDLAARYGEVAEVNIDASGFRF